MKQLRLTHQRLMTHASQNKMLFLLFFIGMTLSLLFFIYFYGNIVPYKTQEYSSALSYRQFSLEFPEENFFNKEALSVFPENEVQDIMVSCNIEIQGIDSNNLLIEASPILSAMLNGNNGNIVYFDLFDNSNSHLDAAILSKDFGQLDEIMIGGYPFTVVKQINNMANNVVFIPPEAYFDKGFPIETLTYSFYARPSPEKEKELHDQLRIAFPDSIFMQSPSDFVAYENEESANAIGAISLMYMVSLLSFLFLFKSLLDESSYEDSVFLIAGASRKKVIGVILTELICITFIGFCLAGFLHRIFYDTIFVPLNIYENIRYHFSDYLLIAALSSILSVLTSVPFIASYMRKTAIELKNQCKE